ncbi:uncharacterized protein LOC113331833 [Papaver somniferum]|uniref:uncharacterized protein LOC113331833 n=1 Tax=Papaver somniferum TaxID=3469 RepID=UPI000E6F8F2F|nr:uncharacterized protein LOC113331833 [Papaver somniferum]
MEKPISEKLEETPINSISVNDFTLKPSTPLATDEGNYRFSFETHFSTINKAEDGSSNRNCEKSLQLHQIFSSHQAESISSYRYGCKVNSQFMDYQEGANCLSQYFGILQAHVRCSQECLNFG